MQVLEQHQLQFTSVGLDIQEAGGEDLSLRSRHYFPVILLLKL